MLPVLDATCAVFARLRASDPGALACVSTSRRASRGMLDALATSLQPLVAARGQALEPMGLVAPNGPAFLAGYLAIRRERRPVLLLDPARSGAERLAAAGALGASQVLETQDGWASDATSFQVSTCHPSQQASLERIAVIKLTSGSTGTQVGVALSAAAILADEDALARSMGISAGDRILGSIPMSHSYGLSSVALPALVRGCLLVLPEDSSPFASLQAASHAEATVFPTAPAWLAAFGRVGRASTWPTSIRLVLSASAPLSPAVARRFRDITRLPVHVFYGASECGGITYDREGTSAERGTVGTPVDGVSVTLEPIPGLEEGRGRVVVRGPGLADSCVPHQDLRLGGGAFHTSDVASWLAGELQLHGRLDGLMNVKGWKVSPAELEAAISSLPGVSDVVVMGLPDPAGTERTVIHALIAATRNINGADVAAHCRATLPLRAVPQHVVVVEEVPRTTLGKLDRAAILKLLSDPG